MGAECWELRQRLKTAAEGANSGGGSPTFTLAADRVVLGYDDLSPDNTFFASILTAGPYLLLGAGNLESRDLSTGTARYRIAARLWLGIARETDNTFVDVEKLLAALKTAWADYGLSWRRRPIDVKKTPALVIYDLEILALGC